MTAEHKLARVVVTGVGVISPVGLGREAFWNSLVSGRSGIQPLATFSNSDLPSRLAAEVRDFDPEQHIYNKKFLKVMSRDIQLGVAAASMAMK
ncbi:MAG TPA: beta-ketoacyl synthase N-terminal-like domain-containing protein, partial [Planctomycetaceae bacterium]|nr:beta-ketoacyl synthase N-terminal-like domain-containing protein [Planctomycetaceae bacterium]